MATILFAHELGMGFGHLNRLLAIAEKFRTDDIVFGVPDPRTAGRVVAAKLGLGPRVIAVGEWRYGTATATGLPAGTPWTLADMLYEFGFGDRYFVADAVATWASQLDLLRPDLVVADFAPMLRIAAANRFPTVVVGNGYTVPPPIAPLPGLESGQRTPSSASCKREGAVLSAVNHVRKQFGSPPFQQAADLFQGDDTFAATFGILDPYGECRGRPPLSPFNIPTIAIGPAHDERTGPHVFCYLDSNYPGLDPVLTALNGLPRPSQIFVRNLDPHEVVRHCAPQVGVHQGQADFRAILPQARLVIHHANLGTAAASLLAGVPQLLLPFTYEQELTTSSLAALDCAVGLEVEATADPAALRAIMETLLTSHRARSAALAQAHQLQASRRPTPELAIVAACRARLAGDR